MTAIAAPTTRPWRFNLDEIAGAVVIMTYPGPQRVQFLVSLACSGTLLKRSEAMHSNCDRSDGDWHRDSCPPASTCLTAIACELGLDCAQTEHEPLPLRTIKGMSKLKAESARFEDEPRAGRRR